MPTASWLSMLEPKQAQLQKAKLNPCQDLSSDSGYQRQLNSPAKTVNPKLLELVLTLNIQRYINIVIKKFLR